MWIHVYYFDLREELRLHDFQIVMNIAQYQLIQEAKAASGAI